MANSSAGFGSGAQAAALAEPRTRQPQASCAGGALAFLRHPFGRSYLHACRRRSACAACLWRMARCRTAKSDCRHRQPYSRSHRQAHDEEASALSSTGRSTDGQKPACRLLLPVRRYDRNFCLDRASLICRSSRKLLSLLLFAGLLIAFSVGWSRMYLGLHYPSDVCAGALIGTLTAVFSINFIGTMV